MLESDGFLLRAVDDGDLDQLTAWAEGDPETDFFDGARTRDELREWFARKRAEASCCLVSFEDRPVGYLEFYPSGLWFHVHGPSEDERPWGMDVLVGDPTDRNRGLGSRLVRLVVEFVLRERGATRVVIDPEAANAAAIRCYEKAGFHKTDFMPRSVTDDQTYEDGWLMEFNADG